MKCYTEAQVSELIQRNLNLAAENVALRDKLSKEALQREEAEKKYQKLCESCTKAYATHKDIITDCLLIQVSVPRFMSAPDFETGILHIIKSLSEKRRSSLHPRADPESERQKRHLTGEVHIEPFKEVSYYEEDYLLVIVIVLPPP